MRFLWERLPAWEEAPGTRTYVARDHLRKVTAFVQLTVLLDEQTDQFARLLGHFYFQTAKQLAESNVSPAVLVDALKGAELRGRSVTGILEQADQKLWELVRGIEFDQTPSWAATREKLAAWKK